MSNINKISTDNIPILDNLMYYIKLICNDIVLKNENQSLLTETSDIIRASDLYIQCVEGRARLELFPLTSQDFMNIGVPLSMVDASVDNPANTPEPFKTALLNKCVTEYIAGYVEENEYYRKLNGLPPLGDIGIKVPSQYITDDLITVDTTKYIHEMTRDEQNVLLYLGVIDSILVDYPNLKYLRYTGHKAIEIYNSRKASKFQLLYIPDIPDELRYRFLEKIEINRLYTLQTIYSDAYKLGSDYYDNFIMMFIIVQTIVDLLAEMPDMIIRRELFDLKMVKLVFDSCSIDYFPEIPYKYQIAMVRNINRLIKFKSTNRNIVDICSLFGFDNIEVFKYYLLKVRRKDQNGKYIIEYKDEDKTQIDNEKSYDLKFLKVPIDGIADDYIKEESNQLDYDEVSVVDKYWDGELKHEYVKSVILDREFNCLNSKYISVDSIYSMTEISFQMVYFYNMIFDNVQLEDMLKLRIPSLNSTYDFKLVDIISYLFLLGYEYAGLKDSLMDTTGKILTVKGFNFKADLAELGSYVADKGYTLEQLGVADFQVPNTSLMTFEQLVYVFTKNADIYDHIVYELRTADNKRIYDIYKKIYDTLLLTDLSMDFFKLKDGKIAKTYTEFIADRNTILYQSVLTIRGMESIELKQQKITEIMEDIVFILDQYLSSERFKYIYNVFPVVSGEAVKKYVYKVIDFFKSYKVQFMGINTIYKFDDKLENKINIIDGIAEMHHVYDKREIIFLLEKLKWNTTLTKEEKDMIKDEIYKSISHIIDKFFDESVFSIDDKFNSIIAKYEMNDDKYELRSSIEKFITEEKSDIVSIRDDMKITYV